MKSIISVNRQALQQGDPPISIKQGGKTFPATMVEIAGPCTIHSDPEKKRQPRVWIVTSSDVIWV
jgi:hypothetical protein